MSDEPRDPQFEDVFSLAIETALATARTMLPGKVVSYDAASQRASIQPQVKEAYLGEDDVRVVQAMPELQDVPVCHFGGASGRITVPVAKGDTGMIIFASSSIARWKLTGSHDDPGDDRHHDISDAVFVPGLHDFAHVPTLAPIDAIVTHGETRVGGPVGTQKMLLAETYRSAEDSMLTALTVLTAALGTFASACTTVPATTPAATLNGAIVTFNAAVTAFQAAATSYLALKGRVL